LSISCDHSHAIAMPAPERPGYELPLLLAGAFRALIDALHEELAVRGHPDARPVHGFALQAIGPDGSTVSELGRRLGVSKQAAAKTAAALERVGYVDREPAPADRRAVRLQRTARGEEMLALSAEIFAVLRADYAETIGAEQLKGLENGLAEIAGTGSGKLGDLPGWLRE
jgi:DNA-binding MarR family transcriptional regulator